MKKRKWFLLRAVFSRNFRCKSPAFAKPFPVICYVMTTTTLKDIDSLDIDFVCKAIENSLRIRYRNDELSKVSNLGDLCDLTISKIEAENLETCTNQEAFYKIRNSFSETLDISKDIIKPKLEISKILPRRKRIENLKKIEKKLGFKLNYPRL